MSSLRFRFPIFLLSGVLALTAWGCGDDDFEGDSSDGSVAGAANGGRSGGGGGGAGSGGRSGGTGGNSDDAGAGGTQAGGSNVDAGGETGEGGAGGTDSGGPEAEGIYVVGGYLTTADATIGYLAVVDDISASGAIDLKDVIEFPDDMSFASPGNGVVFVGDKSSPELHRYVLDEKNALRHDGTMGLAQYGITSGVGMKDSLHFIDEDRAYFIDGSTLQVVVWNPETMETTGAFSIEGFEEEGHFLGLNYVHRDGDRLLLSARYWRGDDTAALLTRVAIIDTTTDSVTYVDDTRCGNVAFHAHDSENNLYLATHPAQTTTIAVGAAGDPVAESCIIRFKAGADDFDPDYYVALDELTGGNAGGIMQGAGDQAFILKYGGPELTLDNYARAPRGPNWEIYSLALGDEEATLEKVPGVGLQSGYGLAFTTQVNGKQLPYVIAVEGDFSQGAYYDVSTPGKFEKALTVPGFPGKAILVK